jgi:hypothetical protein
VAVDRRERPGDVDPHALLLDHYLPLFDVTLREHRVVDVDVPTAWRALGELDLMQVHTPLLDAAMRARGLPALIGEALGRRPPPPPPPPVLTLRGEAGGFALPGWLSLGELELQEIAFGAVGRFWQPDIEWYDVDDLTPDGFAAFGAPGWGRIAASLSLRPYGAHRTLVSYEARTATADEDSARRLGRYWTLVRPFVGHIMRATLEQVGRDATELRRRGAPTAAA